MSDTLRYGYQKASIDPRGLTGQMDARELPRHLTDSLSTIQWADNPLPEMVPSTGGEVAPRSDLFQPGELIDGKYEVRGLLGAGGMGKVFEAKDLELNRLVAVKV